MTIGPIDNVVAIAQRQSRLKAFYYLVTHQTACGRLGDLLRYVAAESVKQVRCRGVLCRPKELREAFPTLST